MLKYLSTTFFRSCMQAILQGKCRQRCRNVSLFAKLQAANATRKFFSEARTQREAVRYIQAQHGLSERRACRVIQFNRCSARRPPSEDRDLLLRTRLRELAEERRRFGSPRLHELLRREGLVHNHKRTERIYQEEGLSLRT